MLTERIGAPRLAELSAQGATLSGRVRATQLPRIAALAPAPGPGPDDPGLECQVGFRGGAEGHPVVDIAVRGTLQLVCQRCLGALEWPVDLAVTLTAVPDEAATQELADPFDCVLLDADGALPLRDAVEDEVLAVLPLAPLHGPSHACGAGSPAAAPGSGVNRPFAALGRLLEPDRGKGEAE